MNFGILLLVFVSSHSMAHALHLTEVLNGLVTTVYNEVYSNKHNLSQIITLIQDNISVSTVKNLVKASGQIAEVLFPTPEVPILDQNIWWGEDSLKNNQDTSIRPYQIKFDKKRQEQLLYQLMFREKITPSLNNSAFSYGANSEYLETFLDYWMEEYLNNVNAREARLNQYPQFMTNIQGLDIHYYHIKPNTTKETVPLLMLHGWPATNAEYLTVIPKLLENNQLDFAFELIVPSIPGFGYSQGTRKQGLASYQISIIFKNFMKRLGHEKFFVHGGDQGHIILESLSVLYPNDVLGVHSTFPYSIRPKTLVKYLVGALKPVAVEPVNPERMYPLSNVVYFLLYYFGYFHIQGSKPDTIGIAIEDTPTAHASWLLTIMSWIDNPANDGKVDGGIPEGYDIDVIIDWMTILWDSKSLTTSTRLYAEYLAFVANPNSWKIVQIPTEVPFSCIKFKHEIIYMPNNFIRDKYPNLIQSTVRDFGSHFAAIQNPEEISNSIWNAIKKTIAFNKNKQMS